MALTKCPECGHDVSTKAQTCPHCGAPLGGSINDAMIGCGTILTLTVTLPLVCFVLMIFEGL